MATPAKRQIHFALDLHHEKSKLPYRLPRPSLRSTSAASGSRTRAALGNSSYSSVRAGSVSTRPSPVPRGARTSSSGVYFSSAAAAPFAQVAPTSPAAAASYSRVSSSAAAFADARATGAAASPSSSAGGDEAWLHPQLGPNEIFRNFAPSFFLQLLSYFYLDELPLLSIVCQAFYKLLTSRQLLLPHPQQLHLQEDQPQEEEAEEEKEDEDDDEEEEDAEEEQQQQQEADAQGPQLQREGDEKWPRRGGGGGKDPDEAEQEQLERDAADEQAIEEDHSYSLRVTDRLLRHLLLRECIRIRRREEATEQKKLLTLRKQLPSLTSDERRRTGSLASAASAGESGITRETYRGKRAESDSEAELEEEEEHKGKEEDEEKEEGEGAAGVLGVRTSDVQRYYEAGASCVREGLLSAFALLPASSTLLSLSTASSVFSVTQPQQQQQRPPPRTPESLPQRRLRRQQQEVHQQQQELHQQRRELHQQQQELQQQQQELQQQQQLQQQHLQQQKHLQQQLQQSVYLAGELLQRQPSHLYLQHLSAQPQLQSRLYFPGEEQQQRYHVYLPGEEQLQLQQPSEQQQQNQPRQYREPGVEPLRHVSTFYSTVPQQLAEDEEELLGYSVIEKILWHMGDEDARLGLRQLVIDCNNAYTVLPKLLQRALLQQAPGVLLLHVHRCEEEKLKLLLTHALRDARQLQEAALQLESGWTRQEATELLAALLAGRASRSRSSIRSSIIRRTSTRRSSTRRSSSNMSSSAASVQSSQSLSSFGSISSSSATVWGSASWRCRSSSYGSQLRKLHVAGDCSLLLAAAHLAQDSLRREALLRRDARTQRSRIFSALHALRHLSISHIQPVHDKLIQVVDIVKQLHVQFPRAQLALDSIVVVEKAPPAYRESLSTASAATATAAATAAATATTTAGATAATRETTTAAKKGKEWWKWRFWRRPKRTPLSSGTFSRRPAATRGRAAPAAPRVVRTVTETASKKAAAGNQRAAARSPPDRARSTASRAVGRAGAGLWRAATVAAARKTAQGEGPAAGTKEAATAASGPAVRTATTASRKSESSSSANLLRRRTSVLTSLRRLLSNQEDPTYFLEEDNVLNLLLRPASGSRLLLAEEDGLRCLHATQLAACDLSTSPRKGDTLHCLFSSLQEAVVESYREELQLTCTSVNGRGGTETGGGSGGSRHCLLPSIGVRGTPRWLASSEGQRHLRDVQLLLERTRQYVLLLPLDFAAALETGLQQRVGFLKPYRHKVVGIELRVAAGDAAPLAHPRGVVDMVVRSLFAGQPTRQKEKLRLLRLRVPADAAVLAALTHEVDCLLRNTPSVRVAEVATPCVAPSRDRWFAHDRGGAAGKQLLLLLQTLEGFGFTYSRRLATPWLCVTIMKRKARKDEDDEDTEDMSRTAAAAASKLFSRKFSEW